MTTNWQERFREFMAEYMRKNGHNDCVKVLSVKEVTHHTGYCETCYHEYVSVVVNWLDDRGNKRETDFYETLADFLL